MSEQIQTRGKIAALDWFRFVAMAMMVQGHTFTAITKPELREALWGGFHDFVHGLTAPMFSFASGLVFGITTVRSLRRGGLPGDRTWRRFERYGTLIFLGYLMHMKAPSLSVLVRTPVDVAAEWLVVDALQCIGVTLAITQAIALFARTPRAFLFAVTILLGLVVLGAPFVDRASLEPLPISLAAYLNGSTGSLFPIFPWAGYVLVGVLAHRLFTDENGHLDARAARRTSVCALVAIVTSMVGTRIAPEFLCGRDYWTSSPWLFVGRVGGTLTVLALLMALVPRMESRIGGRLPRFVAVVSSETLVVYVVHLALLYGTPFTRSLRRRFERDADVTTSTVVAASVFVLSVAVAYGWHHLKRELPRATQAGRRGSIAMILLRFVFAV